MAGTMKEGARLDVPVVTVEETEKVPQDQGKESGGSALNGGPLASPAATGTEIHRRIDVIKVESPAVAGMGKTGSGLAFGGSVPATSPLVGLSASGGAKIAAVHGSRGGVGGGLKGLEASLEDLASQWGEFSISTGIEDGVMIIANRGSPSQALRRFRWRLKESGT